MSLNSEPVDPHFSEAEAELWRAEVASRVSSYRARRGRGAATNASFDFDAAAAAKSLAEATAAARRLTANHAAFDTNYYRRMNAEAMDPAVAEAFAEEVLRASESTFAEPVEVAAPELSGETSVVLPETPAPETPAPETAAEPELILARPETAASLNFDMELHPKVRGGDDLLKYFRIAATEEESAAQSANQAAAAPQSEAELETNLIVFPRPVLEPMLIPKPSDDELAEPVQRRPRILEVPEEIMPAVQGSLFPEIRLEPSEAELRESSEPEIEVPLPVAPLGARLLASAVDLAAVAVAEAIFATIAYVALPAVPHNKPFWVMLGAVLPLLWVLYLHLFLLYSGRTPGMAMRGIRLSTFDGRQPGWSERVGRARFVCISLAAVGLGFVWAAVDTDELCWHDRLSRTFPTLE